MQEQPIRPHQEAQQHEHDDLREPGRGIEEDDDGVVGARRPVADDQSGHVDGEKAGRAERLAERKHDQNAGRDEGRVEPLRQAEPVERPDGRAPANEANRGSAEAFPGEARQGQPPGLLTAQQQFDEHEGEKNGERIVGAGFDLERCANPRAQPQTVGVEEEKHCGSVGRSHHGAGEQGFGPAQSEGKLGERGRQHRAEQDADRGERERRGEHAAKCGKARAQTAVEQDQGQRNRTDEVGGAHVVELDAEPHVARGHADQQEDQ